MVFCYSPWSWVCAKGLAYPVTGKWTVRIFPQGSSVTRTEGKALKCLHLWLGSSLLRFYPREIISNIFKELHTDMFDVQLFIKKEIRNVINDQHKEIVKFLSIQLYYKMWSYLKSCFEWIIYVLGKIHSNRWNKKDPTIYISSSKKISLYIYIYTNT